ncbi:hypothetical protein B0H13DRAFT_2486368 [Mycena leptocephala]|nr:hypothetical protein B0H13DRAFT_2486368 [Mycena leptocephala]
MAEEPPTHLPALDAYTDLEDIAIAAEALSLVVAAFLDDDLLPLDALYTHTEPCRLVLARHEDLYTILKESHLSRNFDRVRNHNALRRQGATHRITNLLNKLRPGLLKFISAGGLAAWSPDHETVSDETLREHIASLGAPAVNYNPSVLLRDLGRFSIDPVLSSRLNNIFVKGHHTFLVNTSGSGKTRLSFEGLCQHWGFYIVGAVDENKIGSADLKNVIETQIPRSASFYNNLTSSTPSSSRVAAQNIEITRRCLRTLLLSRLLVFSMFAEHVLGVGISSEHKKLWLLIQALPMAITHLGDIFHVLLLNLVGMDNTHIQDHIAHLLTKLRGLFGDDFHMFMVIDEAQVTLRYNTQAFRDEKHGSYPILREVVDGLASEFLHDEISFVIVGTEMPKSGFQDSPNVDRHRWCSDTGAFDDQDLHRTYVSRYLPPSYITTIAGKCFLERVWDWCRGRYRFTDSLMETLIRDGFRSPHTLLNDYVERGIGFRPTDNPEFVHAENEMRAEIWITRIDCNVLDEASSKSLTSSLQDVLFHYLVTAQHPKPFNCDHIGIVNLAFGRFIDAEMSHVVVDEPIMLVAVAQWLCTNTVQDSFLRPLKKSFLEILRQYPPNSSRAFACSLALHIARAFAQGNSVSKVFSFPHSVPAWAKQNAEIVAIRQNDGKTVEYAVASTSSSSPLATASQSPEDALSWLIHESDGSPFCLPSSGNPDLIFVLRLAEGTFIRTILHASSTTSALHNSELRHIIQHMDNDGLFSVEDPELHQRTISALKAIPARSSTASRPSLLRIVASFPTAAHLRTATNKHTRGVANLNMGLFKTQMATIPASTIFGMMVQAVTSGKRKRGSEESSETIKRQKVLPLGAPRRGSRVRTRTRR